MGGARIPSLSLCAASGAWQKTKEKERRCEMPKVILGRTEYKKNAFSTWIASKMYELDLTQSDMAELMGITQPAFSNRLKKGLFSYEDVITLLKKLKATDEDILRLMKL